MRGLRDLHVVTRMLVTVSLVLSTLVPTSVFAGGGETLNPVSGPVGTGVTAKLSGWPGGALIWVSFDGQSVTSTPTIVKSDGTAQITFCVPNLTPGIHPTYFVSTLAGMYSGPIFTITPGTAAQCQFATSPTACQPVLFIGVSGIDEGATSTNPVLGKTVNAFNAAFTKKYKSSVPYGLPYPALKLTGLQDIFTLLSTIKSSVGQGSTTLQSVLVQACPNQKIFIIGYSEGAWVVGDALATMSQLGNTTVLNRIGAVVLMGDPKLWWRQPDFAGVATKCPEFGFGPRLPSYMPGVSGPSVSPTQMGSFQFRTYCAGKDPICNATKVIAIPYPGPNICGPDLSPGSTEWGVWVHDCFNPSATQAQKASCQHRMYDTGSLPDEVADWLVSRIGATAR